MSKGETTATESIEAALGARLVDLECQIDRWTALAAEASDPSEQKRCCQAAEEAQSEAHKLRQELAAFPQSPPRRWFDRWTRRR